MSEGGQVFEVLPEDRPRRGRPPNSVREAREAAGNVPAADTAVPRARRRKRVDLGDEGRLRLSVPVEKDPNYEYSWIREESVPHWTQNDDWDPVESGGRTITKPGGLGVTMHLVRKPKEWYEADYREEQSRIVEISKAAVQKEGTGEGGTKRRPNADGFYEDASHNANDMLR